MPDTHVDHQPTKLDRKVTFRAPAPLLIDQFVSQVCRALAESGDNSTLDPEVVSGFSNFIKLMAKVKSKELNGEIGEQIDKREQEG